MGLNIRVHEYDDEMGNEAVVVEEDGEPLIQITTCSDAPEDNTVYRLGLADAFVKMAETLRPERLCFRDQHDPDDWPD